MLQGELFYRAALKANPEVLSAFLFHQGYQSDMLSTPASRSLQSGPVNEEYAGSDQSITKAARASHEVWDRNTNVFAKFGADPTLNKSRSNAAQLNVPECPLRK